MAAGGTPSDLGSLGGSSQGLGINSLGEVAGISSLSSGSATHAVWWDAAGGIHDIGTLGGDVGEARDINSPGQVVGHSRDATFADAGFLWTRAGGLEALDTPTGLESLAFGINYAGQVSGYSLLADNVTGHAVRWAPG